MLEDSCENSRKTMCICAKLKEHPNKPSYMIILNVFLAVITLIVIEKQLNKKKNRHFFLKTAIKHEFRV